jgi:ComF family protein
MLSRYASSLLKVFYPHVCAGCGNDRLGRQDVICLHCRYDLPFTNFETIANNTIEHMFYGRIAVEAASSLLYFSKNSLAQQLVHKFKYDANIALGKYLGTQMGKALLNSQRFENVDCIIPLPLSAKKEAQRGFNQATILSAAIAEVIKKPYYNNTVVRERFTQTQTKKHRTERWKNVEDSFVVKNKGLLANKHVLLIDDVITTGATMEACAEKILAVTNTKISIATVAYASK